MTTFKRPVLEACLPRLTLDAEPVEKVRAPQKQSGGFGCVLLLAND